MNSNSDRFNLGNYLTVKLRPNIEVQGKIKANLGIYLVIESDSAFNITPGHHIEVALPPSGKDVEIFESYVCFLDSENSNLLCIFVPPNMGNKERRKYLRVNAELDITYTVGTSTVKSKTINISAGGAYFFTPERLVVGQEINIIVHLSEKEISLSGRVLRTMQNAATIEFFEDSDQINELASFLYKINMIKRTCNIFNE